MSVHNHLYKSWFVNSHPVTAVLRPTDFPDFWGDGNLEASTGLEIYSQKVGLFHYIPCFCLGGLPEKMYKCSCSCQHPKSWCVAWIHLSMFLMTLSLTVRYTACWLRFSETTLQDSTVFQDSGLKMDLSIKPHHIKTKCRTKKDNMYSSCEKPAIFFQEVLDEAPKKPTQTLPNLYQESLQTRSLCPGCHVLHRFQWSTLPLPRHKPIAWHADFLAHPQHYNTVCCSRTS